MISVRNPGATRCAGLVALVVLSACVRLIDPRQAANTDIGLQVWVQVTPSSFSVRDTVSRIRIRVSAKNPGQDTVVVQNGGPACDQQPDPVDGRGLLHSMRIGDDTRPLDAGPGADICGMTILIFPPKRTRTWDFYVTMPSWKAAGYQIVAQEYRARSYFAGYEGYSALFRLTP